jgi:hypothetical protein
MSTTVKKTPKKTQTSKKQNFIRLNVDENLEKLLQKYEQKYTLLSRSDIIRMLLSEVDWQKTSNHKQTLDDFIQTLPKPQVDYSEEEMFQVIS